MNRFIRNIGVTLILLFTFCHANSQSSSLRLGARVMGMANASACLGDEWSILNNVGGLSSVEDFSASFTYHSYPGFEAFDRMAAVIALPTKIGVAGVSVYRFGSEIYNEQILSAGFSNKFGIASLGFKVNYIQYQADGFGTSTGVSLSFGGIAEFTKTIQIGAHIHNINQPKLTREGDDRLPTFLTIGFAFKPSDNFTLTSEVEKDLDHDPTVRGGIEYVIHKKVFARTGFNINPEAAFAGLGFRHRKFMIDYAFQYQNEAGISHQASLGLKLKKNKS